MNFFYLAGVLIVAIFMFLTTNNVLALESQQTTTPFQRIDALL